MVTDWVRGPYPRPHWQPERSTTGHIPDDGRFYEAAAIRSPPLTIDRALREQCQINVQSYFLAVLTDEGDVAYFSGPESLPSEEIPHIFEMKKFLQYQQRAASALDPRRADSGFPYDDLYRRDGPDFSRRPRFDRREHGVERSDDDLPLTSRTRKRHRATLNRRIPDDDEPPVITRTKKGIKVGNSDEVWDFYGQRFRNIQQNACKLIAKIWVKAVAPKKQTHNPYTAGDEKAPDWWPKPWGPTKEERVRHVEPDHLLKKERVHLLIHILRLIVEPNASQHPDIQKLGINVAKLEELTMESLSGFFNDNGKGNNSKKKPYLKEIFKVAKHEEQYKRGEIDASTEVFVMADDKTPENYQSDDDMAPNQNEEVDEGSVRSSRVSPPKTGPHSILSGTSSGHSPVPNLRPTAPFLSDIPVRGPQYPANMMPGDLAASQHSFVEGGNIAVGAQPPPLQSHSSMHIPELMQAPHDSARRTSSMFNPTATEFPTASSPGIYSGGGWQQSTTAPTNTALYAFNTQPPPPPPQTPSSFVPQQPGVSMSQGSQYLGSQFHPNDVYRGGGVPQSSVGHGPGYQGYLTHDGGGASMMNGAMKPEPLNRGPLH